MPNDSQAVEIFQAPPRRYAIRNLIPRLPERGKIKIGEKGPEVTSDQGNKFQPPKRLDHFKVTTLERGSDGNFVIDHVFHEKFGVEPREIGIRLLYDQVDLNFQTRYACYVGSMLWCSGDGERAVRIAERQPRNRTELNALIPSPREVACTCERQLPTYQGPDSKCKMNGNLWVIIDDMSGLGGVWGFRTTSYNTILGILSSLDFFRSITGGVLANIPFKLLVQRKQAMIPGTNKPTTIHVVGIDFAGTMQDLQRYGHQIALARATTHLSIEHIEAEARRRLLAAPLDIALPGDDNGDVIAEYYPEQIPDRPTPDQFVETGTEEGVSTKEGDTGEVEQKTYAVVDADGIVFESASIAPCEGKLLEYLSEASRRGKNVLDGVWESNAALIDDLAAVAAPAASPALEHYQFLLKQHAPKDEAAAMATQPERRRRRPPGPVNRPKPPLAASNEPPAWVTDGPPLAGAALPDAPSANAASTGSAIGNPQQNPEVPPPVRSPVVVPPASGPKPPGSPIIGGPSQASASPIAGGALQPVPTRQADSSGLASGNGEGRPASPPVSDDALRVRYIDGNVQKAYVHAGQLLDGMRDRRAPTEEYTRFRVINDDFLRDGESAMGDWFKKIKLAMARGERGE